MEKRRKVLLVNPRFQLKYSFFVCSWLLPLMIVFPLLTFQLFDYIVKLSGDLRLAEPVISHLQESRANIIFLLIAAEVCFFFAIFVISLRISHNIAGPLHKLTQAFRDARSGNLGSKLVFRKADHFQELADDYNEMSSGIRSLMDKNVEQLSTSIARLENSIKHVKKEGHADLEQTLAELRKVRESISL